MVLPSKAGICGGRQRSGQRRCAVPINLGDEVRCLRDVVRGHVSGADAGKKRVERAQRWAIDSDRARNAIDVALAKKRQETRIPSRCGREYRSRVECTASGSMCLPRC